MNLTEIAARCDGKPQLKFRIKGSLIDLEFKPSQRIGFVTGESFDVTAKELLAEYELVCVHPFDRVINKGEKMINGGLCLDCDGFVPYGVRKDFPQVPRALTVADDIAAGRIEQFTSIAPASPIATGSRVIENIKRAEPVKPEKKPMFGTKKK